MVRVISPAASVASASMPIMTRGGAQEASLGLLKPVFRIGGPNRLDRLDRLPSTVQSRFFGGPGGPV